MSVPGPKKLMIPLLEAVGDGKDHKLSDIASVIADKLALTMEL